MGYHRINDPEPLGRLVDAVLSIGGGLSLPAGLPPTAEKQGATEFSEDDEARAVALAGAAGIAIDNARLHARVRDLVLIEDRERIAADLHDTVIQRLFATGLALEASVRLASPELRDRI